jgi:hypothetical protein
VQGRDAARAEAFARRWAVDGRPVPQAGTDLAALLADPAIDAVYIATPHAQHAEAIEAALHAGKPVLCEKPLVATAAQAERVWRFVLSLQWASLRIANWRGEGSNPLLSVALAQKLASSSSSPDSAPTTPLPPPPPPNEL